jgi:Xaa-Pro aminopeptidase
MADVDDAVSSRLDATDLCGGGCSRFMSHGPGHGVGLDVHDDPIYPAFTPGAVVNVEPGIYLADERIGIRIEETVLVTATGGVVLSVGAPLDVEEIEALMAD